MNDMTPQEMMDQIEKMKARKAKSAKESGDDSSLDDFGKPVKDEEFASADEIYKKQREEYEKYQKESGLPNWVPDSSRMPAHEQKDFDPVEMAKRTEAMYQESAKEEVEPTHSKSVLESMGYEQNRRHQVQPDNKPHVTKDWNPQRATSASVLAKYYKRQPSISITLPSNYIFYQNGEVEKNQDGLINVFPMTARDELILKSPDALINGIALEQVISNCVPEIKNVYSIVNCDFETIMIALRLSTYGEKMELEFVCPKCTEENTFDADCNKLLSASSSIGQEPFTELFDGEVKVYVKPYTIDAGLTLGKIQLEQNKKIQMIANAEDITEAQKLSMLREVYDVLNRVSIELAARHVVRIETPDGQENEYNALHDFIQSLPKKEYDKIDGLLKRLNEVGPPKDVHMHCKKCSHEWDTKVNFDPSRFFG